MDLNYSGKVITPKISDSILNLLPDRNNTLKNQMFFGSSIDHLFKKGSGVQIDGYIGEKPVWYDPETDYYISETTTERSNYQLEPTMVSVNSNLEYDAAVFYTDYVSSLEARGSITTNQNRLFEDEYYTWCPPINVDMFINYANYYRKSTENADYIIMDSGSYDQNPWSKTVWYHHDDISSNISEYTKAARPIICFKANIELFNYGTYRRDSINYIDSVTTDIITYVNKNTSVVFGNITIDSDYFSTNNVDYFRVLCTNQSSSYQNNNVFSISMVNGTLYVQVETDGLDVSGSPVEGEIVLDSTTNTEYYYNGSSWVVSQQKTDVNQPPLFNLYDFNGVILNDSTKYPNSTFNGSKIFSYSEDSSKTYTKDVLLNMYLNYDSNGNIIFENNVENSSYEYTENFVTDTITGIFFFNIYHPTQYFSNNWYKSSTLSKQNVIDNFTYDGINRVFNISQEPETPSDITVVRKYETADITNSLTTETLTVNVDYVLSGTELFIQTLTKGDTITVTTYNSGAISDEATGYYEIPLSLSCNPNYGSIDKVVLGDVYAQFTSIIQNQTGITGEPYYFNNYRNTAQDITLGTETLEPSTSLLQDMLLSSDTRFDLISSIRYSSNQYRIFQYKYINKITEYYSNSLYTSNDSYDTWTNAALKEITKGMNSSFPFYKSGVGVTDSQVVDYFIPPTPSFLGLYKIIEPYIANDGATESNILSIFCHDGSIIPAYGDIRDDVILNLEKRIYDSINSTFKETTYSVFDVNKYISNAFTTKQYSNDEWNQLLEQFFISWCHDNNVEYTTNTTYDAANPFTWNWSTVKALATEDYLQGHWRGIYRYFYGTDRPHVAPWECLGFANKPSYWDNVYGPAPYTSGNKKLWEDISNGVIDDEGTVDSDKIRSNLIYYLPVDSQGNLLDPKQANIAENYPSQTAAAAPWSFGDGSPIETVWRRSSDYSFSHVMATYLAKPLMFMGFAWDTTNNVTINSGEISEQWINKLTDNRPPFSEIYVHAETVNDSFIYRYGIQQYISNFLISQSLDITSVFADKLRGLDVRLAYRLSGFTNEDNITVVSDTYGVIPDENVGIFLYDSPINETIAYSGMVIVKVENGWRVYGYDYISSAFKILNPNKNTKGFSVSVNNVTNFRVTYWEKNTKYTKGQIVSYNSSTYECDRTHTSSSIFELSYWTGVSSSQVTNYTTVQWYTSTLDTTPTEIPYGTLITSYQDMADLMCGIELYYTNVGLRFDQSDNVHWYESVKEFITWNTQVEVDSFVVLSPLSDNVTLTNNYGNVLNTEEIRNGYWAITDINGKNIPGSKLNVVRANSYVSVIPNDTISGGICGCRFYKNTIEHMLIVDNKTIFDDVIYNPIMNVKQPRLRIQGYKTSGWNGQMNANGFVISGSTIIPNYDTVADNFRYFYDIETVEYNDLQSRARANAGFFEESYFTDLLLTPTNQFEFYQGMIQNKGTAAVINRLMRSSYISNNRDLEFYEEWAFRIGTFGADSIDQSLDIYVRQKDFINDPQLIEFDTQYVTDVLTYTYSSGSGTFSLPYSDGTIQSYEYQLTGITVSSSNDVSTLTITCDGTLIFEATNENLTGNIVIDYTDNDITFLGNSSINVSGNYESIQFRYTVVDPTVIPVTSDNNNIVISDIISSSTGKIITKDADWYWRLFNGPSVDFKKKSYDLKNDLLYNAGYVNLDTVKWTATNKSSFDSLYQTVYNSIGKTNLTPSYSLSLTGGETGPLVSKMLSNKTTGYYRINKIILDVIDVFQVPVIVNIGTPSQLPDGTTNSFSSTTIERITADYFYTKGTLTIYPSSIVYLDSTVNNEIDIQVVFSDIESIDSSISLGEFTITLDVDYIDDSNIMPSDRAWVYDTGNGSWGTYKLYDTGITVYDIEPNLGGTPTLSLSPGYSSYNNVTVSNVIPETLPIVLSGTMNGNVELNDITPKYSNSVSTLITGGNLVTPIITMNVDAGMRIESCTINVLKPFSTTDGSDLVFEIGDTENTSILADSYVIYNPVPTSSSLSSVNPVSVQVANPSVTVMNGSPNLSVYVTRSGNIFGKVAGTSVASPIDCGTTVTTSFTWSLYGYDSNNNIDTSTVYSSGTYTFPNPDTSTDATTSSDYWLAAVDVTIPDDGDYAFVVTSASGGNVASQATSTITVSGRAVTYNLFNPTVPGTTSINPDQFNDNANNGDVSVTLGSNTTGSAVITIKYSYTNGFELTPRNTSTTLTQSGSTFTITSNNTTSITSKQYDREKAGTISSTSGTLTTTSGGTALISDTTSSSDTSGIYGGNIFVWVPTRFSSIDEFNNSPYINFISVNDYVEIDDYNGGWAVCQVESITNGTRNLTVYVQEEDMIDTSLIESSYLYNVTTETVEQYLDIFDPIKGYIQGTMKENIDYILPYNPARYSNTIFTNISVNQNTSWGKQQTGKLWWNTKASPFVNYESGTTEYRWKHWGNICPGTTVEIYEWVRSPVDPSLWESYVISGTYNSGFSQTPSGTIDSTISYSWVEDQEWNDITGEEITVYYFWVLNPTTVPVSVMDKRTISANKISYNIQEPIDSGIPTFSVIDSNMVTVSGAKQFMSDTNTTMKINWKTKKSDKNFHKEWTLVNENDDTNALPSQLWTKMKDSVSGYSINSQKQTFTTTTIQEIRPTDTVMYIDATSEDVGSLPINGDVKINDVWYSYGNVIGSKVYGITTNNIIPKGTEVTFIWYSDVSVQVPDPKLTNYESIGCLIRPQQSWFLRDSDTVSSRYARRVLVDYLNNVFAGSPYIDNWYDFSTYFNVEDTQPDSTTYVSSVSNLKQLEELASSGNISYGDCVLVEGNSQTNGFWSLWSYMPYLPSQYSTYGGFIIIDSQKWRLQDGEFWSSVDWYATGYSSANYPVYIFKDLNERNASVGNIDLTLLNGTLVQVNSQTSSDSRWSWAVYDGTSWTEVAKESSTIQLSSSFYENTNVFGVDNNDISLIPERDGTLELRIILENLYSSLFTVEQVNELFFAMVKCSMSQNNFNNWVFKTSLLYLGGYFEQLSQSVNTDSENITYILDYVDVVKPYHVTIRDYVSTYTIGPDISSAHVSDFDFPPYYDALTEETSILHPYVGTYNNGVYNSEDTRTVENSTYWSDWYNNFNNMGYDVTEYDTSWNPVRRIDSAIIFDRKQCSISYGWDMYPWDIYGSSSGIIEGYIYSLTNGKISDGTNILYVIGPTFGLEFLSTFRQDTHKGHVNDQNVQHITDLQKYNSKVPGGTIFFVEDSQSHHVYIDDLITSACSVKMTNPLQFYDYGTGKTFTSNNFEEVMGITPESVPGSINTWVTVLVSGWDAPIYELEGAIVRVENDYNPTGDMISKDNISALMNGCGYKGTEILGGTLTNQQILDSQIVPNLLDLNGINYADSYTISGGTISDPTTSQYNTPEEAINIMPRNMLTISVFDDSENLDFVYNQSFTGSPSIKTSTYYNNKNINSINILSVGYDIMNILGFFDLSYTVQMLNDYPELESVITSKPICLPIYLLEKEAGIKSSDILVLIPTTVAGSYNSTSYTSPATAKFPFFSIGNYDNGDGSYDIDGIFNLGMIDTSVYSPDELNDIIISKLQQTSGVDSILWSDLKIDYNGFTDVTDDLYKLAQKMYIRSYDAALAEDSSTTTVSDTPIPINYVIYKLNNPVVSYNGAIDLATLYMYQYSSAITELKEILNSINKETAISVIDNALTELTELDESSTSNKKYKITMTAEEIFEDWQELANIILNGCDNGYGITANPSVYPGFGMSECLQNPEVYAGYLLNQVLACNSGSSSYELNFPQMISVASNVAYYYDNSIISNATMNGKVNKLYIDDTTQQAMIGSVNLYSTSTGD